MRAAIYARYSSQNQSEKSVVDQVRVCKQYIAEHGMTLDEQHIYTDEAISGSLLMRPGLQAVERAAEQKEFDALVVDDLSRLSRSNHQMLTLVLRLNYFQVKLISVSDGIITDDENAKLGIHVRGLINEMYLDDLKKKTIRGLEGQKLRGFSAGEAVYGYRTKPVGELKLNKKGQAKYDGMVHYIDPEQAEIVRRIFKEFTEGKAITRIVADLNQDRVPTKKRRPGGWNVSTVSRILKNERYIGKWVWKQFKNVRDPITGKRRRVPRPEAEHVSLLRADLIIVDQSVWDNAQKKWKDLQGTWPVRKDQKGSLQQKSYVHTSPRYLLSGLMKCQTCEGAILLVSGKGSGYYGCFNARRRTCGNGLWVSRNRIEQAILSELQEKLLTAENLTYVYQQVAKAVNERLNEVPATLKNKKAQLEKVLGEIRNYLEFVRSGNLSKAVAEALKEAEAKSDGLQQDITGLEAQGSRTFEPPPKEWITLRLERLRETLHQNVGAAAQALKELLGTVRLEPITDQAADPYHVMAEEGYTFKPYYVAHTNINTLALLNEHQGAKWSNWWRRRELHPRLRIERREPSTCVAPHRAVIPPRVWSARGGIERLLGSRPAASRLNRASLPGFAAWPAG